MFAFRVCILYPLEGFWGLITWALIRKQPGCGWQFCWEPAEGFVAFSGGAGTWKRTRQEALSASTASNMDCLDDWIFDLSQEEFGICTSTILLLPRACERFSLEFWTSAFPGKHLYSAGLQEQGRVDHGRVDEWCRNRPRVPKQTESYGHWPGRLGTTFQYDAWNTCKENMEFLRWKPRTGDTVTTGCNPWLFMGLNQLVVDCRFVTDLVRQDEGRRILNEVPVLSNKSI